MNSEASEILNAEDWGSLHHAYGVAVDVPELLHGILASDAKTRESAWYALCGNVWHQGTVYPATVPCVRVLLQMLRHGDFPDPERAFIFLGMVADGAEVHDDDAVDQRPVMDAIESVLRGFVPHVLIYLQHPRSEVRASCSAFLGFVPDCGSTLLTHLRLEQDPAVRAQICLALSERDGTDGAEGCLRAGLQGVEPERTACALSLLRLTGVICDKTHSGILREAKNDLARVEMLEQHRPTMGDFLCWLEDWDGSEAGDWYAS